MTATDNPMILVVEDDPKVRLMLRRCFEGDGYRVCEAGSGAEAERAISERRYDLVTLDLNLPDCDGLSLARTIRAKSNVPIVMVTGKGETIDRVVGLEIGADDYISKPFHVREVLARIRAVLRRTASTAGVEPSRSQTVVFDGWVLDLTRRDLTDANGKAHALTTAEFDLLKTFTQNAGRVLTRDQIMDHLKGHDWVPLDRSIDNLVARLRKKVEKEPGDPKLIRTVRGAGYVFTPEKILIN